MEAPPSAKRRRVTPTTADLAGDDPFGFGKARAAAKTALAKTAEAKEKQRIGNAFALPPAPTTAASPLSAEHVRCDLSLRSPPVTPAGDVPSPPRVTFPLRRPGSTVSFCDPVTTDVREFELSPAERDSKLELARSVRLAVKVWRQGEGRGMEELEPLLGRLMDLVRKADWSTYTLRELREELEEETGRDLSEFKGSIKVIVKTHIALDKE